MRILLIILFVMPNVIAQSIRENVNTGNDAYRQEEYEEALKINPENKTAKDALKKLKK